jgi:hypothetical protein
MSTRLLCFALLALPAWGWQSADQSLQAKLGTVSGSYSLYADGFLVALSEVAGHFQLPMGIEWIKVASDTRPFRRSWAGATPSAILHDILKDYPQYEFEASNGVVHVFPTAMKGDPADVLNARIGTYEVHGASVTSATQTDLAERVRKIMVPNGRDLVIVGSILSGEGDGPVTFRIDDATVRDVLDKFCLGADLNIWIVTYPPEPAKTGGGFLKTIPVNENVQRDDDTFLPTWRFLPWGSLHVGERLIR